MLYCGFRRLASFLSVPEWRNWQTRGTQNPVGFTPRVGSIPSSGTINSISFRHFRRVSRAAVPSARTPVGQPWGNLPKTHEDGQGGAGDRQEQQRPSRGASCPGVANQVSGRPPSSRRRWAATSGARELADGIADRDQATARRGDAGTRTCRSRKVKLPSPRRCSCSGGGWSALHAGEGGGRSDSAWSCEGHHRGGPSCLPDSPALSGETTPPQREPKALQGEGH